MVPITGSQRSSQGTSSNRGRKEEEEGKGEEEEEEGEEEEEEGEEEEEEEEEEKHFSGWRDSGDGDGD